MCITKKKSHKEGRRVGGGGGGSFADWKELGVNTVTHVHAFGMNWFITDADFGN